MGSDTNHKYISEFVWLPTYVALAVMVLGNIENSAIASLTLLVSLIGTRMVFETIYRMMFDERRLLLKNGLTAFLFQFLVWGTIVIWSKS